MDCDYEPSGASKKQIRNPPAGKKHKKSAFYEAVAKKKPVFDPETSTFEKYLEEYYAMDFEDLIGDMPCRFKYRKVPQQDFGLTIDEILASDSRTLNSWCSLKRVVQHRTQEEEAQLKKIFSRKAKTKKKKHFTKWNAETEVERDRNAADLQGSFETKVEAGTPAAVDDNSATVEADTPKKRKNLNSRQRRRKRELEKLRSSLQNDSSANSRDLANHKLKHGKRKDNDTLRRIAAIDNDRLKAYGLKPEKVLKKAKYGAISKQDITS